ncbi:MAG: hypothetical protein IH586_18990 [Anaerolineaceae bacterium]|nr:hypothetical protein [Anaerolineaceae bacterium]
MKKFQELAYHGQRLWISESPRRMRMADQPNNLPFALGAPFHSANWIEFDEPILKSIIDFRIFSVGTALVVVRLFKGVR